MRILAIDSTANVATAAICEDERVIKLEAVESGLKHSEMLLPMIERELEESGLSVRDIDLFACSAGPGSFTGVRIGVATIKGLAFGGRPCIGVSSLFALALNMQGEKGIICAAMDARRDQLYNALFRVDGEKTERLCEDRVVSAEELSCELSQFNENIYVVGDGYDIVHAFYKGKNLLETDIDRRLQRADSVAKAAVYAYNEGKAVTDRELKPIYLRLPQAERERNERIAAEKE